MAYGRQRYYGTRPDGRGYSKREFEERQKLLRERESCPDCEAATIRAVREGLYYSGACQCARHKSR